MGPEGNGGGPSILGFGVHDAGITLELERKMRLSPLPDPRGPALGPCGCCQVHPTGSSVTGPCSLPLFQGQGPQIAQSGKRRELGGARDPESQTRSPSHGPHALHDSEVTHTWRRSHTSSLSCVTCAHCVIWEEWGVINGM